LPEFFTDVFLFNFFFFFFSNTCDVNHITLSYCSAGDGEVLVLATGSVDKKVKLWAAPAVH
jgi:hypothetical protein